MHPNEKNAFRALEMFSVMVFIGLKSEVHITPRHFEAVVGFSVVDPTSTLTSFGALPCECKTSSHFRVFICWKFSAKNSSMMVAWVLLDWGSHVKLRMSSAWPREPSTHHPEQFLH